MNFCFESLNRYFYRCRICNTKYSYVFGKYLVKLCFLCSFASWSRSFMTERLVIPGLYTDLKQTLNTHLKQTLNTHLMQTLIVFSFLPKNVHFISKNSFSCLFLKNVSPSKRVICFILNNLYFPMVEGIAFYALHKSRVLVIPFSTKKCALYFKKCIFMFVS